MMRKKWMTLVLTAVLVFTLSGCDLIQTVQGPDLEKPVFVKMLVYADDMDVDLYYICNDDWEKTISKVEIPNARKGVDCTVYDEEVDYDGKYNIVTAHIGVNDDNWSDENGLPEDISITDLNITWSDGSKTTEDLGQIVIAKEDIDYDTIDEDGSSEEGEDYYFSLKPVKKRTEITGLEVPFKDLRKVMSDVYINEKPLSEISFKHPLVLEAGESCEVSIVMDTYKAPEYGEISAACKLLMKSGAKEVKYTNIFVNERFGFYENAADYLKAVLKD